MKYNVNTGQMITIWHASILTALILSMGSEITSAIGICLIAAVIIFSLAGHPNIRKKAVLLAVLIPYLVIGIFGGGYLIYRHDQRKKAALSNPLRYELEQFRRSKRQ